MRRSLWYRQNTSITWPSVPRMRITSEDVEEWRAGAAHAVYRLLQGLIKSGAWAITQGSVLTPKDDGVYIDLFRIPPWFYEEGGKAEQA